MFEVLAIALLIVAVWWAFRGPTLRLSWPVLAGAALAAVAVMAGALLLLTLGVDPHQGGPHVTPTRTHPPSPTGRP